MKKLLSISISFFVASNIFAMENNQTCKAEKELSEKRVIFSIDKNYKAEKLVCKQMDLMNGIFEAIPMGLVRLFKAAVAARKLLDEISQMKPIRTDEKTGKMIYFETKEEEINFIKSRIKGILDPIDKFLEEALANAATIVKALFEKILGENAKQGFILPALASGNTPSIYLVEKIESVEELRGAISEFDKFFKVITASLSDNAKKSYAIKLKELQQAQKNSDNKKEKIAPQKEI